MSPHLHYYYPDPSHRICLSLGFLKLPDLASQFSPLQSILSTSVGEIPVNNQMMWVLQLKTLEWLPIILTVISLVRTMNY